MDQERPAGMNWHVRYDPLPSQDRFHQSRARFKGFSGPVGSGKSMAMCFEAFRLATVNPGCQGLLGAPTYRMLRDVTQVAILRLLDENDIPYEFHKADNIIVLGEVNSEILLRSLDQPERLRGTNLAWFGIDELTFTEEGAWTRLEARLRDPRAVELCGFAVWTPNGHDWVYSRFIKSPVEGYECVRATPHENRHILDSTPDFYRRLEHSYDPRFYRQEALGEYLNIQQGRVYECFDRERNVAAEEYRRFEPLYWSFDFNVTPLCSVVAQRRGEGLHAIAEICLENATVAEAVDAFHGRYGEHMAGIVVTGDASGRQRNVMTGGNSYTELRHALQRAGLRNHSFRIPAHNPSVLQRVKLVNALLLNSHGDTRLTVDAACRELIRDFDEVLYKANEGVVDKSRDPRRTHISDALGYLAWELYGEKPKIGEVNQPLL